MSRPIKFRGQCLISKELVYGDLIIGVGNKSGKCFILPRVVNLASVKHCHSLDGVEVDPETVGQFTGLHDKNGKEIYESDILKTETDKNMVVGWSDKYASFVLYRDGWMFQHYFGESADPKHVEVIGNIHQNPELIDAK